MIFTSINFLGKGAFNLILLIGVEEVPVEPLVFKNALHVFLQILVEIKIINEN